MDMVHGFWEDNTNLHRVKFESSNDEQSRLKDERSLYPCCDGNLNFATAACSEDDSEYGPYKKSKVTRQDPMSHRIIEKRRRDRMNNCLADLSRLIPTEYLKKGRGRIEKTEIIEMAIKHMKFLQQEHGSPSEQYRLGYQECMSETMRFMVEVEGHFPREAICVRLLNHLQKHCDSISHAGPVQQPQPTSMATLHARDVTENPPLRAAEYPSNKCDQEVNNNNAACNERAHHPSESEIFEKHVDGGVASYKYKNDIKLRFNQDLHAVERHNKRQKIEVTRRNSTTSIDNHSSSHSSPPSSDLYTRNSSESDNTHHRISPTESSVSAGHHHKTELIHISEHPQSFTHLKNPPHHVITNNMDMKSNFNVPVFVLHAKGSFYVPLTIDYKTLLPYLHNYDLLEVLPSVHNIVLHPVTINVNFQPSFGVKSANYKSENNWN